MRTTTPIRQVEIGSYYIRTVHIPVLSVFTPECYETMVFNTSGAIFEIRHLTEKEAVMTNLAICQIVQENFDKGYEVTGAIINNFF